MRLGVKTPSTCAFSLVEVVLAVGIVSFGLLAIVGSYGSMFNNARDSSDRREIGESVEALRCALNNQQSSATINSTEFDYNTVYGWASLPSGSEKVLAYLTYKSDSYGSPTTSSSVVQSRWIDTSAPPYSLTTLESARVGRWILAKLRTSTASYPNGTLPATSTASSLLAFQVDLDTAAAATLSFPIRPKLSLEIGVLRSQ